MALESQTKLPGAPRPHMDISPKNGYILLRHGESEANKAGIIVSSPEHGIAGYGLTDTGLAQARGAGEDLKRRISQRNLRHRDVVIVCSDFKRASQTGDVVYQCLEREPALRTDVRLRERFFGDFDMTSNERYHSVWREDAVSSRHTKFNVESVVSVLNRTLALVNELEETFSHKQIVLVAHGDTLQILQTAFSGTDPSRHRQLPPLATAEIREVAMLLAQ